MILSWDEKRSQRVFNTFLSYIRIEISLALKICLCCWQFISKRSPYLQPTLQHLYFCRFFFRFSRTVRRWTFSSFTTASEKFFVIPLQICILSVFISSMVLLVDLDPYMAHAPYIIFFFSITLTSISDSIHQVGCNVEGTRVVPNFWHWSL